MGDIIQGRGASFNKETGQGVNSLLLDMRALGRITKYVYVGGFEEVFVLWEDEREEREGKTGAILTDALLYYIHSSTQGRARRVEHGTSTSSKDNAAIPDTSRVGAW